MQVSLNVQNIYFSPSKSITKQKQTSTTIPANIKESKLPSYAQCISFRSAIATENLPHKKRLDEVSRIFKDNTGNFSLDKATMLIKNRIDTQLMPYSENDIKLAIKQVQQKYPEVSKEQILQIMGKLSSFSNYESMSKIEQYLKDEKFSDIVHTEKLTLNSLIVYLAHKNIIDYVGDFETDKLCLFVDRNTIEYFKELKEKDENSFNHLKNEIQSDRIRTILLDGWEAKTKNGYKSFNIAGRWGNLAETVSDIIETEKNIGNKSVYINYLYDELIKLFGNNFDFDILRNSPKTPVTEKIIAERLNTKTISTEEIKTAIEKLSNYIMIDWNIEKNQLQEMLCKFLLTTVNAYSPRKMAKELKELHQKLNAKIHTFNKEPQNAIYIVPNPDKSFGLTNYQYSRVNDTPYSKYTYLSTNKPNRIDKKANAKNVFILCDDFSGTGLSLTLEQLLYEGFKENYPKSHLIFAPLAYTQLAKDNISTKILTNNDLGRAEDAFIGNRLIYDYLYALSCLPKIENNIFKNCFDKGFGDALLSIGFQHVIPDNCSDISAFLLEKLLVTEKANKAQIKQDKRERMCL